MCVIYTTFLHFVDYSKHIMATFNEIDSLRFEHKTLMSLIVLSMFSAFFDIKKEMGRGKK